VLAPTSAFGSATEVSLIGQNTGSITSALGSSAVHLASGAKVYARGIAVTAVNGVGLFAESGSTLRLDHVTVANSSKGGISLGGAAFDISNSTITGNGPGSDGAVSWGGIYIQLPPSGGPTRLNLVSVTNNKSIGVACTNPVASTTVLVSGNAGGDITTTCGFLSCGTPSATCGAQP
jgi:hypothetical protein